MPRQQHSRDGSGGTGIASSNDYGEHHGVNGGRRHDYDVQSMETAISSPRASITKNPIPAPTVTVRSEFPTLSRSRQQQSLTCLVTIEVPEGKWSPDPADIRGAPILPSMQPQGSDTYSRPKSPAQNRQVDWPFEPAEVLEEITEDLRVRVDNWHGLDFSRHVISWFSAFASFINLPQIWPTTTLRYRSSRQRPPIMARARMLPLRGNAHMRQGKEGRSASVCRWRF